MEGVLSEDDSYDEEINYGNKTRKQRIKRKQCIADVSELESKKVRRKRQVSFQSSEEEKEAEKEYDDDEEVLGNGAVRRSAKINSKRRKSYREDGNSSPVDGGGGENFTSDNHKEVQSNIILNLAADSSIAIPRATKSFDDIRNSLQSVVANLSNTRNSMPHHTQDVHNTLVCDTRKALLQIISDLDDVKYNKNNSRGLGNSNSHRKAEKGSSSSSKRQRSGSREVSRQRTREKDANNVSHKSANNDSDECSQSSEEETVNVVQKTKGHRKAKNNTESSAYSSEDEMAIGKLRTLKSKMKIETVIEKSATKTPVNSKTADANKDNPMLDTTPSKESNGQIQSSRSSDRLRSKAVERNISVFDKVRCKEDLLKEIESTAARLSPISFKYNSFSRKQTNNFIYGANNYNSERAGVYGEDFSESDDSFIDDSVDSEPEEKHKRKSTKRTSAKRKKRKKSRIASSEEENDGDSDSGDDDSGDDKAEVNNSGDNRNGHNDDRGTYAGDQHVAHKDVGNLDGDDGSTNNGDKDTSDNDDLGDKNEKAVNKDNGINVSIRSTRETDNKDNSPCSSKNKQHSDSTPTIAPTTTRSSRVLRQKERTISNLERLQKLRSAKEKLRLKEKEKILRTSSCSGSDNDDLRPSVLQEESSDREFINDDEDYAATEKDEPPGDSQTRTDKESSKTTNARLRRVVTQDTSDDDEGAANSTLNQSLTDVEKTFFKAVNACNVESVKCILDSSNIANHLNENRDTALHIVSRRRNHELLILLLEYGANPNLDSLATRTPPLSDAALARDPSCFETLLRLTSMSNYNSKLSKVTGKNILHLLVTTSVDYLYEKDEISSDDVGVCINILKHFDRTSFRKYLFERDKDTDYPLVTAIKENCVQGVCSLMLEMNDSGMKNCFDYDTDEGGNLIHFAVQYTAECLKEVLPYVATKVNDTDVHGYTPLMYAAELGKADCLRVLYEAGASIIVEADGHSPLHLAAATCDLESVRFLLRCGHSVFLTDNYGWPPLLYATFKGDKDCVIELFKKDPSQLFCLSKLINGEKEEMRDKNRTVIQKTLESISHIDSYYTLFNDFIGRNLSLLDNNNLGVFMTAWKRILSFENKAKWLRNRYTVQCYTHVKVDRSCVLKSAMDHLKTKFSIHKMSVTFKGEAGSCLGPKREFLDCLVKDTIDPKNQLFTSNDNKTFRPLPNQYFLQRMEEERIENSKPGDIDDGFKNTASTSDNLFGNCSTTAVDSNFHDMSISDNDLLLACDDLEQMEMDANRKKLKEINERLRFIGRFVARVVLDKEEIALQFTNSFLNKILDIPLNHPECLSKEDYGYYRSIKENDVDDLEICFSAPSMNPWTGKNEEICLADNNDKMLTEINKEDYLKSLSSFLYEKIIEEEVEQFRSGFYQCIHQKDISIFTADEFCLLLNGVSKIDVDDWQRNTKYCGWEQDCEIITWFWRLVRSLKEEEKALLLKFATGSPCVPIGGFANLRGLGSDNQRFTIRKYGVKKDKLPGASTCFNQLKLPEYSNEETLRDKVLIAIRHGCEGFEFS